MEAQELFNDVRAGNREAFDSLVRRFNDTLVAFAHDIIGDKAAAQDVVQDTLVHLWLHRGRVKEDTPVVPLLYIATRNRALNYVRSRRRAEERYQYLPEPTEESAHHYVVQEEALRLLEEAISKLPARTAQVIRLRLDGLKQEEIAREMNVTVANVKRLNGIAIERLRRMLGPLFALVLPLLPPLQP